MVQITITMKPIIHLILLTTIVLILSSITAHSLPADRQLDHLIPPLYIAAITGNLEEVRLLIADNADIDATDQYGITALHGASEFGRTSVVQLLLDNGADIDATDRSGATPLHNAVSYGFTSIVQLLIDHNANVDLKDGNGNAPLHMAVMDGRFEIVKLLLDSDANVHAIDGYSYTPLLIAASKGYTDIALILLENGAYVGEVTSFGQTPLHGAADNGHPEMIALLLENGADGIALNHDGETALDYAIRHGNEQSIKLLIRICPDDWLPLHYAAAIGYTAVVEALVAEGESITALDAHNKTPLDHAYEHVQIETIEFLESQLPSLDMAVSIQRRKEIAIDILVEGYKYKIEKLLTHPERYHIALNHDTAQENTLLMTCIRERNEQCTRRILEIATINPDIPLDVNAPYIDPNDSSVRIHPLDYVMNHANNADLTHLLLQQTKGLPRYFDLNVQHPLSKRTALTNAISNSNLKMVQLFVDTCIIQNLYIDISLHDAQGMDMFQIAANHPEISQYLSLRRTSLTLLDKFRPFRCYLCLEDKARSFGVAPRCRHPVCNECESMLPITHHGQKQCGYCRGFYTDTNALI